MGLDLEYFDDQTPIDEEEKDGLLILTISTRVELNEFEQLNIEEAMQWAFARKFKSEIVFTEKFIRDLHKRMYGNVWSWAGKYRKSDKNIGIDKHQISTQIKILCDDVLYWVKEEIYSPDEIALRFKHRMVSIHCFPNGNGRHSRLMADIIIEKIFSEDTFTWGAASLSKAGDNRATYLRAVKIADLGNFEPLIAFSRS